MTVLLTVVIDAAIRGLVVASAIGAVLMLVPRHSARLRLRAWTLVLYAVIAMPIVALAAPAWRSVVPPVPVFGDALAFQTTGRVQLADIGQDVAPVPAVVPASTAWPLFAPAIYAVGLVWLGCQALLGWRVMRRLYRRARPVHDAVLIDRLLRHTRAARLQKTPRLMESSDLFSPVTMFVRRPVVVLPADWRTWPAEQLDGVIAHEFAHIARRDAWTQRLALLYRAVFWFSPLSWWLQRQLSRLAELASDESALAAGVEPLAYADALLGFYVRARNYPRLMSWHLAMARRDDADAARRIERILSWKGGPDMTRIKLILAGVAILIAPLTVLAASVRMAPATVPAIVAPIANIGAVAPLPMPAMPAAPNFANGKSVPHPPPDVLTPPAIQAPTPQPPAVREPQDDDFLKGAYEMNTAGLVKPVLVKGAMPRYTPEAMRQKLQGTVEIDVIIGTDGTVTKARVKVSLDKLYGLDESALETAKQWTFTPGLLKDEPVAVHTILKLEFRLH